jgi:hypothetical protein
MQREREQLSRFHSSLAMKSCIECSSVIIIFLSKYGFLVKYVGICRMPFRKDRLKSSEATQTRYIYMKPASGGPSPKKGVKHVIPK